MNRKIGSWVQAIAVLVVGLAFATSASAARTAPLKPVEHVKLETSSGKAVTAAEVKQIILNAAKQREWVARESGPNVINATILVRGQFRVTVDIPYSPTEFSIKYVSSENMNYSEGKKGPIIHANYNKWVNNLSVDIRKAAFAM